MRVSFVISTSKIAMHATVGSLRGGGTVQPGRHAAGRGGVEAAGQATRVNNPRRRSGPSAARHRQPADGSQAAGRRGAQGGPAAVHSRGEAQGPRRPFVDGQPEILSCT
jgi:hypothetical protein